MENNAKKYDLTNDYIFKRTFGYVGQEHITKIFLRDLFLEEVSEVDLDNSTITEKDIMTDKMGIMDVKAVIDKNVQCDIEVQVVSQDDIEKRILFYLSSEYKKSITKGQEYGLLKKTIAVLVADFELKSIADVPKYATKWNFREEDYPQTILTDAIEVYIIELPKLTKHANNTHRERLNLWAKFIKEPEVKIVMDERDDEKTKETKKSIEEAQEAYKKILENKHDMELAELREKYVRDQISIKKTGYRQGRESGIEEGKALGRAQEKIETAKKFLEQGVDKEIVTKATGLTKEQVEELAQDIAKNESGDNSENVQ